jgi:hypothetical protein
MITLGMNDVDKQIGALVVSLQQLPRNLANKHLKAAVGRAVRPFVGVLRRNTPPMTVKRGRPAKRDSSGKFIAKKPGPAARSTGALRRSVAVRTKARKAVASAILGYRAGAESRKAIWLEFGTSRGIDPREMVKKTMDEIRPKVQSLLPKELKVALERAARDSAPPGTQKFRG